MNNTLKIAVFFLLAFGINSSFAQQSNQIKKTQSAGQAKKVGNKKGTMGVKNKIAVSDQATPSKKTNKKETKKESGASNK